MPFSAQFKSTLTGSVGSSMTPIYSISGASSEIIGLCLANTAGDLVTMDPHVPVMVDVAINRNGALTYLCMQDRIEPGSALNLVGRDMKLTLQSGDTLFASCTPAGKVDAVVSSLENFN